MIHAMRILVPFALVLLLSGFEPPADRSETGDKKKAEPGAGKEATKQTVQKLEKGPFKVEVSLKGVFEAPEAFEIALRPEAWTPDIRGVLTVKRAVEHGIAVKKGDVLIALDLEKIDERIKDFEVEAKLKELTIKQTEEELPVLEKSLPLDLTSAERAGERANADLKRFLAHDRSDSEKNAHYRVKQAGQHLDYEKEELRQLEKMYRAKDLTEETEEIILKRQRNDVESAAHYLKNAEIERDRTLKVELPRKDQDLHENALKTIVALEKMKLLGPLGVHLKRLSLAKMKHELERDADKLAKLKRDRDLLTVKSPVDGVVYFGKCERGQWTGAAAIASKLHRGGMLNPDEVVLTVVKPKPLMIRAVIEEKDLHLVHVGLAGKAIPTSFPDQKLAAKVERVSAIPITSEKFEARLSVELPANSEALTAGMSCTVKLVPYKKADALVLPTSAVLTDELDDDIRYVNARGKDGKPEKRTVEVGKQSGGKIEIVKGLQEGDEVFLEKPDSSKKSDTPPKKGD